MSIKENEHGIRLLYDDTLAQIDEGEITEEGKLSNAGRIALKYLSR